MAAHPSGSPLLSASSSAISAAAGLRAKMIALCGAMVTVALADPLVMAAVTAPPGPALPKSAP